MPIIVAKKNKLLYKFRKRQRMCQTDNLTLVKLGGGDTVLLIWVKTDQSANTDDLLDQAKSLPRRQQRPTT